MEPSSIKKAFLFLAVLATANSFYKTDINLALFLMGYLLWPMESPCRKGLVSYLMAFTSVVDLIYVATWAPLYQQRQGNSLLLIENYTLVMTCVIAVAKACLLCQVLRQYPPLAHGFTPEGLKDNVTQALTFS